MGAITQIWFHSHITVVIDYHSCQYTEWLRIYMSLMINHCGSECLDHLFIALRKPQQAEQEINLPQLMQKLPPWWKRCFLPGMTLRGCWLCNLALHNISVAPIYTHWYHRYLCAHRHKRQDTFCRCSHQRVGPCVSHVVINVEIIKSNVRHTW